VNFFSRFRALAIAVVTLASCVMLTGIFSTANSNGRPKPDANASQSAFLDVCKVLISPRCQNCHPAGDAPLQGDDSHVHIQNVKRGADGHGVAALRCNACHQDHNLPGAHMPPGNPKWSLPAPEHKMVFVGRSAGALCRQLITWHMTILSVGVGIPRRQSIAAFISRTNHQRYACVD
jgi:hypothetical protein